MAETERRRGEGHRGDVDDQHRAGGVDADLTGTPPPVAAVPEQRRQGSSAELLDDPGLDGRLRRAWLRQKVSAWRAKPPAGFTNPRPAPTGARWTPPVLVRDSAELEPLGDVAEEHAGLRALAG
ncbi:MAG: hypothetical protein ACRDSL_03015 [Pseudonocardiaceae bacterium]